MIRKDPMLFIKPIRNRSPKELNGRKRNRVVAFRYSDPRLGGFLFEENVQRNWRSEWFVQLSNNKYVDREEPAGNENAVYLFEANTYLRLLVEFQQKRDAVIQLINSLSDADFYAAAELIRGILEPGYKIPEFIIQFRCRCILEFDLEERLHTLGLSQLNDLLNAFSPSASNRLPANRS